MNFEELIAFLGDDYKNAEIFSCEDRDMTDHETEIKYFMNLDEAIELACKMWDETSADDKDYRDISVHRGYLEYYPKCEKFRFIVLQKMYKSYKKTYVCKAFADKYRQAHKEAHMAEGMTEEEAAKQARKDFKAIYCEQEILDFGMFEGYDYEPKEWN